MVHVQVTKVSLETFRERSAGKKVVLLYPWTNYRNLFLSHFLSNSGTGFLYYRIIEDPASLSDWLAALAAEFDDVLGGFGSNLRAALEQDAGPAQLGEALAADLRAYSADPVALFIDEFDRTPLNGDIRKFMKALLPALAEGHQLAFSSRLLTHQPWYDMVAAGEAVVLGTEHRKDDVMFTVEPKYRPQLEVYALGRGYALANGQPITNWDGALPRNLFFFFMDRPLVTRDEIFATFWPNLPVKEATNVFHVTKRKISERISMKVGSGNYELTRYSGGFYVPSEKIGRHYDVGDFQSAIERAMIANNDEEEERLLMQAIEFYKAPYLQTVEMPWAVERRNQLRQLNAQALIGMGRLSKRQSNLPRALGFFIRALKETPQREDIHREVMSIYLKLGMKEDARQHYLRLAEMLRTTLGINPSRESQELFKLIEAS
jgi:two-component SAPR family response regulator